MSHFFTWVMVPEKYRDNDELSTADYLDEVMAPYSEQIVAAPYEDVCYCVGHVAKREVEKRATERFGTYDELRGTFNSRDIVKRLRESKEEGADKKIDSLWRQHIRARRDYERKAISRHPMKDKPDPTCGFYTEDYCDNDPSKIGKRFEDGSGCGGTGKYISRYNKDAHWDWWVVGGRWDGTIQGSYRKDEKDGGFNFGDDHHQLDYNAQTVEHLLKLKKKEFEDLAPFALVDGNGVWHEKGKMGWWGMTRNEKGQERWNKMVKEIMKQWPDAFVVGVDCHI